MQPTMMRTLIARQASLTATLTAGLCSIVAIFDLNLANAIAYGAICGLSGIATWELWHLARFKRFILDGTIRQVIEKPQSRDVRPERFH